MSKWDDESGGEWTKTQMIVGFFAVIGFLVLAVVLAVVSA